MHNTTKNPVGDEKVFHATSARIIVWKCCSSCSVQYKLHRNTITQAQLVQIARIFLSTLQPARLCLRAVVHIFATVYYCYKCIGKLVRICRNEFIFVSFLFSHTCRGAEIYCFDNEGQDLGRCFVILGKSCK